MASKTFSQVCIAIISIRILKQGYFCFSMLLKGSPSHSEYVDHSVSQCEGEALQELTPNWSKVYIVS